MKVTRYGWVSNRCIRCDNACDHNPIHAVRTSSNSSITYHDVARSKMRIPYTTGHSVVTPVLIHEQALRSLVSIHLMVTAVLAVRLCPLYSGNLHHPPETNNTIAAKNASAVLHAPVERNMPLANGSAQQFQEPTWANAGATTEGGKEDRFDAADPPELRQEVPFWLDRGQSQKRDQRVSTFAQR